MAEPVLTVEEAAIEAERAYRRGFQQGHTAATKGWKLRDLWHWRFRMPLTKPISPEVGPETIGGLESVVDRFECELRDDDLRRRVMTHA